MQGAGPMCSRRKYESECGRFQGLRPKQYQYRMEPVKDTSK